MRAADTSPACPVCALPTGPDDYCQCGWVLGSPRRLGPVTDVMRADFDKRLAAARLAFDARAAALVSPVPARFGQWIRGGPPNRAQWALARQHAAMAAGGAFGDSAARKELAALLRGVAPGSQALLIEVAPEGIGVTRAIMDRAGAPRFEASQPVQQWPDLVPGLSAHPEERLLQLAGGHGRPAAAALRDRLDEAVRDPAQELDGVEAVLVVCRPAGWALLEAAAELCAELFPGAGVLRVAEDDATAGTGTIGTLTASMPLLHGYAVIVATVDPVTGEVAPATQPLFQPGAAPGAEASVTLRRFPGDRERATLAVAVDAAWSAGPQVVAVHTIPQPEPLYTVSAVLDQSGRVVFTGPHGILEESRPWTEVWAGVPRAVDVRPSAVDLVCAIELTGSQAQVARRKKLVSDLLAELAAEYPQSAAPRVSVIGCVDHLYEPGAESKTVVRGTPLGPVGHAVGALAELRGEEIRYPEAASLEDLLYEAHRMLARTPKAGRVGRLLLVAGRRPHPPALTVSRSPGAPLVQPCPKRHDWRNLTRQLGKAGVGTVAVADTLPLRSARGGFWAETGAGGLYSLSSATAQAVGEDLGLLVRDEQRPGLPLPALTQRRFDVD
jgi:hypothetical protein